MIKKLPILLILGVALLFPSIVAAQGLSLFAKQRVVIAPIIDRNDREINPTVKNLIYQGFRDVITNSSDYEIFEVNIDDIKANLKATNTPPNPENICKKIGEKADFIIFTTIKISSSAYGAQAQSVTIFLSTSLYRIKTASEVLADQDRSEADETKLLSMSSALMARMLGIKTTAQAQTATTQQPAYSQPVQPAEKTYKVGDYYDVNGKQGVVYVVTPDGQHGKMVSLNETNDTWSNAKSWCSSLGSDWRLPTKEELLAIYRVKEKLNQALAAVGDEIPDYLHWSSSEYDSERAWSVHMYHSSTGSYDKYHRYFFVRATSAF